ncbi:MAG: copper chaperone Copz family protein [Chloroflexi bacterium]|nr:copper chaperone Copz family protein [Chloroflexota bacterium]
MPAPTLVRAARDATMCAVCGEKGKPVQGQTVKSLLAITLRQVRNAEYLFCRTPTCRVVYFSTDGAQTFTAVQVRERVYQKEPDAADVFVCYCFRHTLGEIRAASPEARAAILDDINTGIQTDQCACDLRNPQGSCCLGNVRALLKRLE